jgi:SMI1-KNR4 cell-wall
MSDYTFLSRCSGMQQPCSPTLLRSIEEELKFRLPEEYKQFLLFADGGTPTEHVILFSCGHGIHPAETLRAANKDREKLPVYFIGRFAEEEFGFLRKDTGKLQRPVYLYEHETCESRKLADSFEEFLGAVMRGKVF